MIEAKFYKKEPVNKTRCVLCPHRCFVANKKTGACLARQNIDGVLYAKNYGQVASYAVDPIEKKPLYHFLPGSEVFSIGTWGCNFKCNFCQNWNISQQEVSTEYFEPADIVETALHNKAAGIAYTYNEPFIWYEFVCDTAKIAKNKGLANVLVTNGFVSEEPLRELLPLVDAVNVDMKAPDEKFYREILMGQLAPVKRTMTIVHQEGCHMELTTLIIPTLNDKPEETEEIARWVASDLGPEVPLHLSRYFPHYKMDIEPTPIGTLKAAFEAAKKHLKHVYLGNVPAEDGVHDTICAACGNVMIKRKWPEIHVAGIKAGVCAKCGHKNYGRF